MCLPCGSNPESKLHCRSAERAAGNQSPMLRRGRRFTRLAVPPMLLRHDCSPGSRGRTRHAPEQPPLQRRTSSGRLAPAARLGPAALPRHPPRRVRSLGIGGARGSRAPAGLLRRAPRPPPASPQPRGSPPHARVRDPRGSSGRGSYPRGLYGAPDGRTFRSGPDTHREPRSFRCRPRSSREKRPHSTPTPNRRAAA
jgi:hypothetical protein